MVGAILSKTSNYGFNKIRFDMPGWHGLEHDNWTLVDTLLNMIGGIPSVKGVWLNSAAYEVGDRVIDPDLGGTYRCAVAHTSAASGTFAADRTAHPSYWTVLSSVPNFTGAWATGVVYSSQDMVVQSNAYYLCVFGHTSGVFADDLAAGHWQLIFNLQPALDAQAAAEAAQTAAETAETNAETAESNAAGSASSALSSKNAAATSEANAATSAGSAATSAGNALTRANAAFDSAAAAAVSEALAQKWATQTSAEVVAGQGYGAKKYAIDAAASAAAAALFDPALYMPKTGGIFSGLVKIQSSWPSFDLHKWNANEANQLRGFSHLGQLRWVLQLGDNTVETGANVGSRLALRMFDDTGTIETVPLTISRATGVLALLTRPTFAGNTPWDNANLPATTTGKAVLNAADTAAARTAIEAQPVSHKSSGSVPGYIESINTAPGNGYVLPAGGTWEYLAMVFSSPGAVYGGTNYVGVAAGGTTIAGASGYILLGRAKRIA